MRRRIKPPLCMGQRMHGDDGRWFLKLESIGLKVVVNELSGCTYEWSIFEIASNVASVLVFAHGPQAAANAAERWLVKRAELTLKLAGRRAG